MEAYIDLDESGFTSEEFADVKRCLETICSVRAGSQPLIRDFGIDYNGVMGYPINVAKNMLALDIIEKISAYEPRVTVVRVDFDTGEDGQLIPHPHFIKNEEE